MTKDKKGAVNISRRTLMAAGVAGAALSALPTPLLAMVMDAGDQPLPELRTAHTSAGRAVELWHWAARGERLGHILFSHGASSSPRHYQRLCGPWAAAGYDVLAPLHVDSTEHPRTADFAGSASWTARIEDMRLAAESLNGAQFIAAGHSYGALTAIALGGGVSLVPADVKGGLHHPQTVAVLAFSPPPSLPPLVGEQGYAPLAVPSFHQTGTRDFFGPNRQGDDWLVHLHGYDAAPEDGRHYALVLPEVDHYFGGLIGRLTAPGPAMPDALDQAVRLSTQFVEAVAVGSAEAQQYLTSALQHQGLIGFRRK